MPPFIAVMGTERSASRAVRVGGQTLKFGSVTYVDLGGLSAVVASPTATESEVSEATPGQEKETAYYYVVTATDAFGGETLASPEFKSAGTQKGSNASGAHHNEVVLKWTAVPGATGYNVYRGTATGKETLLASTTEAKYADVLAPAAEKTAVPPTTNNTFVNSGKGAKSPRDDLKNHLAIGAVLVLGGVTSSNLDWVPVNEAAAWELTLESEKVKVKEAKELRQRSTGTFRSTGPGTASLSSIKSTSGNEKYVAVVYNTLTNVVEAVTGTDETEGNASVALVLAKVTAYQQLLYLLNTKGTTKTVTNATSLVPNPPVIARV
jgi:hypothetical protein